MRCHIQFVCSRDICVFRARWGWGAGHRRVPQAPLSVTTGWGRPAADTTSPGTSAGEETADSAKRPVEITLTLKGPTQAQGRRVDPSVCLGPWRPGCARKSLEKLGRGGGQRGPASSRDHCAQKALCLWESLTEPRTLLGDLLGHVNPIRGANPPHPILCASCCSYPSRSIKKS